MRVGLISNMPKKREIMKLKEVMEIVSKEPESKEEEQQQAKVDGALFQHCHDKFLGLVKALGEAMIIIGDEYPAGSEEHDSVHKFRELLDDVSEVKVG